MSPKGIPPPQLNMTDQRSWRFRIHMNQSHNIHTFLKLAVYTAMGTSLGTYHRCKSENHNVGPYLPRQWQTLLEYRRKYAKEKTSPSLFYLQDR